MTKLAPEWVRTSDPVIRSPARYRWTTAPASAPWGALHGDSSTALSGNLISDIFVETRVHVVAGKLTSSSWLQPGYARMGLRQAAR